MEIKASGIANAVIARNEQRFIASTLGEEMMMMDLETGDFISLNRVGTDIWNLLEKPLPFTSLVQSLMKAYQVSEKQCLEETLRFLQQSAARDIFVTTYGNSKS